MNDTRNQSSTVKVFGIDLAKHHCDVVGFNRKQKICFSKKLKDQELFELLSNHEHAIVLMEACKGSHFKARKIADLGHDVRLVNPIDVKKVRGANHKNDKIDAIAIATLAYLPGIRFVHVKTSFQQDLQILMRAYQGRQKMRIEVSNRIHALLEEVGIPARKSTKFLQNEFCRYVEERKVSLSRIVYEELFRLHNDWKRLYEREQQAKERILGYTKDNEDVRLLKTIPGVGDMVATAVMIHVGDPKRFKNSRQFAASTGLIPQQYSTGGKSTLLHISKRGPKFLRSLLVQAANVLCMHALNYDGKFARWIVKLLNSGKKYGVIRCAVAAKLSRIIWRILVDQKPFQAFPEK